jgi:hypothetical protein
MAPKFIFIRNPQAATKARSRKPEAELPLPNERGWSILAGPTHRCFRWVGGNGLDLSMRIFKPTPTFALAAHPRYDVSQ